MARFARSPFIVLVIRNAVAATGPGTWQAPSLCTGSSTGPSTSSCITQHGCIQCATVALLLCSGEVSVLACVCGA